MEVRPELIETVAVAFNADIEFFGWGQHIVCQSLSKGQLTLWGAAHPSTPPMDRLAALLLNMAEAEELCRKAAFGPQACKSSNSRTPTW